MTSASDPGPLAASEPLQPQDLVITLLGTYVRPFGDTVWSGGLVALLGELGFSHGAARVALTRLVRRGLISRVRSGRLVHYQVTARCDRVLAEGDGRIFLLGNPRDDGGSWTVLWHQIPEDRRLERSRLARRLRFLGFGSVQDSVWVSPHDHSEEVTELLAELDVAEFAALFEARAAAAAVSSGLPALVARAWDLSGLVDRYDAFAAEFSPFLHAPQRGRGCSTPRRSSCVPGSCTCSAGFRSWIRSCPRSSRRWAARGVAIARGLDVPRAATRAWPSPRSGISRLVSGAYAGVS